MGLELVGRHALLFDDDAAASFVNSPQALVPWNDDASLLIDRYDIRHLLDRIPTRSARRPLSDDGGVSQSELDLERYLDLPPPENLDGADSGSETMKRSEVTNSGTYQAVPLYYGDDDSICDSKTSDSGAENSVFHPPFAVPESLLHNLPPTEKLHQIIARTAVFVSNHGGQSEIVLRVKQGDNPTFGFLMPDHHLHAYFRYLVDHPKILEGTTYSTETQEKRSGSQVEEAHIAAGGALSMLGSVYGSGDDDAVAVESDSIEMKPDMSNDSRNQVIPGRLEHGELPTSRALEDKETIERPVAVSTKERIFLSKRNPVVNSVSFIAPRAGDARASTRGALDRSQVSDTRPLILEPPSSLKGAIDKIVEFILRNGKEFEAILIEQDKAAGRFPFLLPSNQYHSYYLKILSEEQESKRLGKNPSDQKHGSNGHVGSKKRRQETPTNGHSANSSNLQEHSEGLSSDLKRKDKFKMTIGATKKDTHDQPPISGRPSKLSSDEVAAIILAATRGSSPANANQHPTAVRQSGASADEAAAIVLAATRGLSPAYADQLPQIAKQHGGIADVAAAMERGLSPAKTDPLPSPARRFGIALTESRGSSPINSLKSMPMEELDGGRAGVHVGKAFSTGSFSSLDGHNRPVVSSVSSGKSDTDTNAKAGHVLIAKVVANTVSLAASTEANSSEASLTKEEMLKAQRLKRAKLFTAAIKGGTSAVTDFVRSGSVPNGSAEFSNTDSIDVVDKESTEISEKVKFQEKDNRDNRSRKTYRSRSKDHVDVDDCDVDLTTSRKKHRTQDSPHHSRENHRHQYHYTSRNKDSRHHKQHRPSEDDRKHRRELSFRRRHMDELSENDDDHDDGKRSDINRRKHRSHSEKQRVTQDKNENAPLGSSNDIEDGELPSASDAQLPDATEVPSDLRAKIRAMLLETM